MTPNVTLNSESQEGMVLPCIEVNRFEKIAAWDAMIGRHNSLAQKLEAEIVRIVSVHCHVHRFGLLLSFRRFVQCTKMWKHFNAIMEVFYCFTVVIGLPGEASGYNEDKRSSAAGRMQSKVVVEW